VVSPGHQAQAGPGRQAQQQQQGHGDGGGAPTPLAGRGDGQAAGEGAQADGDELPGQQRGAREGEDGGPGQGVQAAAAAEGPVLEQQARSQAQLAQALGLGRVVQLLGVQLDQGRLEQEQELEEGEEQAGA